MIRESTSASAKLFISLPIVREKHERAVVALFIRRLLLACEFRVLITLF